jgi:hypothetical protein
MMIIRTPVDAETLRHQVAAMLGRGLVDQPVAPIQPGALTIVTNGPSARSVPASILSRPNTLAVNGAMRLFTERHLAPRFWLSLDPQALVADFVARGPQRTRYLIASQCHPAVFDTLADRTVRPWHVRNPVYRDLLPDRAVVDCGLTSTLAAIAVARQLLGFRRLELYGWDGCLLNGADHAVPQGFAGKRCRTAVGQQIFETSPDWLAELDDARVRLQFVDARIRVHGPGLAGAYLRHLGITEPL